MSSTFSIRSFNDGDIAHICQVEFAASQLFLKTKYHHIISDNPLDEVELRNFLNANKKAGGDTLVAIDNDKQPVGFLTYSVIEKTAYVRELSVDPDQGRKGCGSKLLEALTDVSKKLGLEAIGLSTFIDVKFNAPYYEARGFMVDDPNIYGAQIAKQFLDEVPVGVSPNERVFMMKKL